MTTSISVVITTHNEATSIGGTLRALASQIAPDLEVEVIVVDDRSTDATLYEVSQISLPKLLVLSVEPDDTSSLTTRQRALDLGFRRAAGEIILTLDADSRLPRDWIIAMTQPILDGRADAVAGPVGFQPTTGLIGGWQSCDTACYLTFSKIIARLGSKGGIFFGNFAFRRPLYNKMGGFTAIGRALTEDLSFGFALQQHGAKLNFVDGRALVEVNAAPSLAALVARLQRVTRGPPSILAIVLVLWQLSLFAVIAYAVSDTLLSWQILGFRFSLGLIFTTVSVMYHGNFYAIVYALIYEPLLLLFAFVVIIRKILVGRVSWGGLYYD